MVVHKSLKILCVSVISVVISPLLLLILSPLYFFLVNLAKMLSIFIYLFKKNTSVLLIFSVVFLFPISFISALIIITFLLLTLGFIYYSFSSFFRYKLGQLVASVSFFLMQAFDIITAYENCFCYIPCLHILCFHFYLFEDFFISLFVFKEHFFAPLVVQEQGNIMVINKVYRVSFEVMKTF